MSKRIVVLGDHNLEFSTHRELDAVLARLQERGLEVGWHPTDGGPVPECDGLWIAPGSPYRDEPAVLAAIREARSSRRPLLGTCGGFQFAAMAVSDLDHPTHAESSPEAEDPFIAPIECRVDGEWRTVTPRAGTRLAALLGSEPFEGIFYCGYAPSAGAEETLGDALTARAEGIGTVALELTGHPFFMATLFHPQVGALAGEPLSPLIEAFVDTSTNH